MMLAQCDNHKSHFTILKRKLLYHFLAVTLNFVVLRRAAPLTILANPTNPFPSNKLTLANG